MRGVVNVLLVLVANAAAVASAAPCQGVDRTLTEARRAALSAVVARQLQGEPPARRAEVLASFSVGSWSILQVDTPGADEAFLFYPSDPSSSRYLALWSGAARRDEQEAIETWARDSAPGIPPSLAECFAWHVTAGRAEGSGGDGEAPNAEDAMTPGLPGIEPGFTRTETVGQLWGDAETFKCAGDESCRCYADDSRSVFVVIRSGVAGGFGRTVTAISIAEADEFHGPKRRCTAVSRLGPSARLSNGLRLGMSRGEVIGILGPPKEESGGRLRYERRAERRLTPGEVSRLRAEGATLGEKDTVYSDWAEVTVEIVRGRAVAITAERARML